MKQFFIGFFQSAIGLLAPFYMLLLVWFIKWDSVATYVNGSTDTPDPSDDSLIVRGDLPEFLKWAQTMDMRFPGGMYEPTVKSMYGNGSYLRKMFVSYYWAGHRNRAQGLAMMLGKPAADWIPNQFDPRPGYDKTGWTQDGDNWYFKREADGIFRNFKKVGPIYLVYGYEVYRLSNGKFWAVNQFTINFGKK